MDSQKNFLLQLTEEKENIIKKIENKKSGKNLLEENDLDNIIEDSLIEKKILDVYDIEIKIIEREKKKKIKIILDKIDEEEKKFISSHPYDSESSKSSDSEGETSYSRKKKTYIKKCLKVFRSSKFYKNKLKEKEDIEKEFKIKSSVAKNIKNKYLDILKNIEKKDSLLEYYYNFSKENIDDCLTKYLEMYEIIVKTILNFEKDNNILLFNIFKLSEKENINLIENINLLEKLSLDYLIIKKKINILLK